MRNTLITEGIDTTYVLVHPESATGVALIQAEFASVAAAISVTRAGAQPSLPRRDEVEQFIRERIKKQ